MTTPIPTPFDIIELPPEPLVPSPMAWILTALVFAALLLVSRRLCRRVPPPPVHTVLSSLLDEFKSTAALPRTALVVERLARLSKRILSVFVSEDIDSLSSSEMCVLATTLNASSDECKRSCAAILNLLAQLEELAYAPRDTHPDLQTVITQLEQSLDGHIRRYRTR